jgi:GntR family transcriptional regulator
LIIKDSGLPYYLQIYNELRRKIISQIYLPGQPIPSENELVGEFGVTRATVRNAVKKLQDEGLVFTKKGKGSYVNAPKIEQSLFKFYSFGRNYSDFNISSALIEVKDILDADVQRMLNISAKDYIKQIIRIRKLDNIPVILEISYIPADLAPDIESFNLENLSIYDLLEQHYGYHISKAKEYLDPSIADSHSSKLLEIEKGKPVFVTERITYDTFEKPIEYRKSIIRSDKFRFSTELK